MRRVLLALVVALAIIASCQADHECIHDELVKAEGHKMHVKSQLDSGWTMENGRYRKLLTTGRQPIRIMVDVSFLSTDTGRTCYSAGQTYNVGTPGPACSSTVTSDCFGTCTQNDVLTTQKQNYLVQTVIPTAMTWLQTALLVDPQVGNLVASAGSCGFYGGVTIPTQYTTTGAPGTDLLLFLTARPTFGSVIAYAGNCQVHPSTGRATVGQINWGPAQLSLAAEDLLKMVTVAIHETSHALGFSSARFSDLRDANFAVIQTGSVLSTVALAGTNSQTRNVQYMITPNVQARARTHFGCASLEGGEIESAGGSGTAGSHWKKRVFNNEFMTGSISQGPVKSDITLAFFQDSGWYDVNYTAADSFEWGANKGCNFVKGVCTCANSADANNCNWPGNGYTCSVPNQAGCDFSYRFRSYCNLATYSSALPTWAQYFPSPLQGGSSDLADYCAWSTPYSNGDCSQAVNAFDNTAYGESYAAGSRCMMSTLTNSLYVFSNNNQPRCYSIACTGTSTYQVFVNGVAYNCPSGGTLTNIPGFSGSITCPPAATLCSTGTGPTFISITPAIGSDKGGTPVTLLGTGFVSGTTTITLGGISCTNVVVDSAAQIRCTTAPKTGTNAAVDLTIVNGGRTLSASAAYTYSTSYPYISLVLPASGPAYGGQRVTLIGSGFDAATNNTVFLDSSPCSSVIVVNSTLATCTSTAYSTAAVTAVTVRIVDGQSPVRTGYIIAGYSFDPTWPQVSSVYPNGGNIAGGSTVLLTGTYFSNPMTVRVDGSLCTSFSFVSATRIMCAAPAHLTTVTPVDISVVDATSRSHVSVGVYTYDATWPSVTSVDPVRGPAYGTQTITVHGSGFDNANQTTIVTVGTRAGTSVNVATTALLTLITPSNNLTAASALDIGVTSPNGRQALLTSAFTQDPNWPRITLTTPNGAGLLGGATLRLDGQGFTNTTPTSVVLAKGVNCTEVYVWSSTVASCIVGGTASPGVGSVSIVDHLGRDHALSNAFEYAAVWPTFVSVTPRTGPAYGTFTVTIVGTLFDSNTVVSFGNVSATSVNVLTASTLTCVTPAVSGSTQYVDVLVGNTATNKQALGFRAYLNDASWPRFLSIYPSGSRSTGSAQVDITGQNLNSTGTLTITLNGIACTSVQILSDNLVRCTTGNRGAVTYELGSVAIVDGSGRATAASSAFIYSDSWPLLSSITPTSGSEVGGTVMTLTGSFNCSRTYTVSIYGRSCMVPTTGTPCTTTTLLCTTTPMFVQSNALTSVFVTDSSNQAAQQPDSFTVVNLVRPDLTSTVAPYSQSCGIVPLMCAATIPLVATGCAMVAGLIVMIVKQSRYT
eukprot:TRINITY_DN63_c0_g1_i1.p1 TRINITY_DN63_c0_g1~~TRINITY_DN63_c0_g1_i1.p1  ORF type:complete len:1327 (-),score=282.99 TRINITY_DN63_c0_g1_i1:132-4112(-)